MAKDVMKNLLWELEDYEKLDEDELLCGGDENDAKKKSKGSWLTV